MKEDEEVGIDQHLLLLLLLLLFLLLFLLLLLILRVAEGRGRVAVEVGRATMRFGACVGGENVFDVEWEILLVGAASVIDCW